LKEKEEEEDGDKERQTGKGNETRLDGELKKTRIEIPGLH
jgi:hypothetical protein